jgi:peptidoglycan/LPS O-acetylase OafA/YrhL
LRRGLKIYPQFYFFIAVMFTIFYLTGKPSGIGQAAAELAFVQNYATGMWSHTWSLAIEEHFYLLLTLVIVLLARRGGPNPFRPLPGAITIAGVVILGLRVVTWKLHPEISDYRNVFPSHLRIDSLLAGVMIAYYHTFHNDRLTAWMRRIGGWAPPLSILLLSPITFLTREDPFMVTIGFSMVAAGFVLLLLSVLYPMKPAAELSRGGRAMARLGQVSYAFYLWHAPILLSGDWLKAYAQVRGVSIPLAALVPLTFVACLGAAFLTTRLVEIPVLRLRDRRVPAAGSSDRVRTVTAAPLPAAEFAPRA